MHAVATTAATLRHQLQSANRSGAGKPFPEHLRLAVVQYAEDAAATGKSVGKVARELGISAMSIIRWQSRSEAQPKLPMIRRVEVVPDPPCASHPVHPGGESIVVHGPGGLRVEGLTVSALADLLRALR